MSIKRKIEPEICGVCAQGYVVNGRCDECGIDAATAAVSAEAMRVLNELADKELDCTAAMQHAVNVQAEMARQQLSRAEPMRQLRIELRTRFPATDNPHASVQAARSEAIRNFVDGWYAALAIVSKGNGDV